MPKAEIKLFITGGTLDKDYNKLQGALVFNSTHLPEMLDRARCRLQIVPEILMLKDSLELEARDRELVAAKCSVCPQERIVITHGTDSMAQTAWELCQLGLQKRIVLLGAMIPYSFGGSDALFNLGCALTAVQLLPPGVYITMNGRILPGDQAYKDKESGDFRCLA